MTYPTLSLPDILFIRLIDNFCLYFFSCCLLFSIQSMPSLLITRSYWTWPVSGIYTVATFFYLKLSTLSVSGHASFQVVLLIFLPFLVSLLCPYQSDSCPQGLALGTFSAHSACSMYLSLIDLYLQPHISAEFLVHELFTCGVPSLPRFNVSKSKLIFFFHPAHLLLW